MHAFAMHVSQFLHLYDNIVSFTQQGLEKLNDFTTKYFQSACNHQDGESLKQVLQKQNYLELLQDCGYQHIRKVQKCSICKLEGHNKRSRKNRT